jgi:hypothetical protein
MKKIILTAFMFLGLVLVSQAQTKHTIGEKFGGGIVFFVSADGLKGLIVEKQDQGKCKWKDVAVSIANEKNHCTEGREFTDWRLPTYSELILLYQQKTTVGGFRDKSYWSSTVNDKMPGLDPLGLEFTRGDAVVGMDVTNYVRVVREF